MKITTKLMMAALLASVPFVTWSCDNDDDKDGKTEISIDQLPKASATFLSEHFSGATVLRITRDTDRDGSEYEVTLTNGFEIEFDGAGEWTDVDAPAGQAVPSSVVPTAIASYVTTNYPGQNINEISRDSRGYEVELTSGTDLEFDRDGNFIRIDR